MSYVSKRYDVDDTTIVALRTVTAIVISGGVVTDGGAANSKVNVSAVKILVGRSARSIPAVALLSTLDTQHICVDPADNVVKSVASAVGLVKLATIAIAAGVCTPTAHRTMLDTITE